MAEGFTDIEHIKRYTTLGIGTEQGATSAVLGAAIVAELKGEALDKAAGISRQRAPFQPVALQLARGFARRPGFSHCPAHAARTTGTPPMAPCSSRAVCGCGRAITGPTATMPLPAASRKRAACARPGGIADGSTLGKIEIAGADAAAFLDSMYLTKASTIKVGRSRYMVNLREDGMVLDDGLVLRLRRIASSRRPVRVTPSTCCPISSTTATPSGAGAP